MQKVTVSVTTGAGTTAAVNASVTATGGYYNGKLHSVYLNYGSVTNVTNVTIASDVGVIATFSDSNTDAWKFPRSVAVTPAGAAHPATAGVFPFAVVNTLRVSVSSSTPSVLALTATLYIEN